MTVVWPNVWDIETKARRRRRRAARSAKEEAVDAVKLGPWSKLRRTKTLGGRYVRGEAGRAMGIAWTDGAWSVAVRIDGRWRWAAGREHDAGSAKAACDARMREWGVE